jgi:hypothetical protein
MAPKKQELPQNQHDRCSRTSSCEPPDPAGAPQSCRRRSPRHTSSRRGRPSFTYAPRSAGLSRRAQVLPDRARILDARDYPLDDTWVAGCDRLIKRIDPFDPSTRGRAAGSPSRSRLRGALREGSCPGPCPRSRGRNKSYASIRAIGRRRGIPNRAAACVGQRWRGGCLLF